MDTVAVVSCHVERPLDDRCWRLFARLAERRPGGFPIAALLRPPDLEAGEDGGRWLVRAHEARELGPVGHHTHFGGPTQARPLDGGPAPGARVRAEAAWLRECGLSLRLFCGGGWYVDEEVACAVAELGYADCTATRFRPAYLDDRAPRLQLPSPAWLSLGELRLLELPTTHSLGMLAPRLLDPQPLRPKIVHVYFHDTDLLSRPRRLAISAVLRLLARRRGTSDLERLADELAPSAPEVPFSEASRP